MSEIQTEHYEKNEVPTEAPKIDPFGDILEWQAREAAQRILEQPINEPTEEPIVKNGSSLRDKILVGTAAAAAVTTGVLGLNAMDDTVEPVPTFSEQTNRYIVQDGDGIYDAAESISGIDTVDVRDAVSHITSEPLNIDVLKDGLQAGDQLVVPVSINGVESSNE